MQMTLTSESRLERERIGWRIRLFVELVIWMTFKSST